MTKWNNMIQRSFPFLVLLLISGILVQGTPSQTFEGTIEFTKTTGPVVTSYRYYVKGDDVRIEEINGQAEVQGVMLVDTRARTVTALSPDRKLFMDVPNMRLPKDVDTEVKKTEEVKDIAGYKCQRWVVRSTKEDRQVSYWVANDGFHFFVPLLETLNRKDEQAVFFLELPGADGVFPMSGLEQKLDGSEVSRLEVKKVTRAVQRETLFEVPPGYSRFERN
jgi:Domain of unknown function (DUF4412)